MALHLPDLPRVNSHHGHGLIDRLKRIGASAGSEASHH